MLNAEGVKGRGGNESREANGKGVWGGRLVSYDEEPERVASE